MLTAVPWPMRATVLCTAFFLMLGTGCARSSDPDPAPAPDATSPSEPDTPTSSAWFAEEAASRGIAFEHVSGHRGGDASDGAPTFLIPEITVGGVATLDFDRDGWLDLYFVQSGSLYPDHDGPIAGNQLYRNRGDGTFEDVTASSGADDAGYGCGVATGDFNNDGWMDLYVTNVGPNVLYQNNGDGSFTDVSVAAGVADDGFGSSATFFDADADGDLDLFVLNYLVWSLETERTCKDDVGRHDYCAPVAYNAPALDVLYRNNGDGTFTDVSESSGIGLLPGTGLGVVAGDFDGDGRVDVFVANDGYVDRLWIQKEDGTFEDRAMIAGCAVDLDGKPKAGMGVATMDDDDDGDLDLIVCNLTSETDSLFRNMGGYFQDVTARQGLASKTRLHTRFGLGWLDFNNDGFLDLFHANGRVQRDRDAAGSADPYAEPNLLHVGSEGGRMTMVAPAGGTEPVLMGTSRGAAFGDFDNDGGIDIAVLNRDAAPHLLMNRVASASNWIGFAVLDEHGRHALGAVVIVEAGGRAIRRDVRTGYSYCSANDPRVHVGLGGVDAVSRVTVRWVDGTEETFDATSLGSYHTLRRGAGT